MNVNELNTKLNKIINDYADAINSKYPSKSDKPVTEGDIQELGRQVFHMTKNMKKEIIAYLKEQEDK